MKAECAFEQIVWEVSKVATAKESIDFIDRLQGKRPVFEQVLNPKL
jgi:hypothetical protein